MCGSCRATGRSYGEGEMAARETTQMRRPTTELEATRIGAARGWGLGGGRLLGFVSEGEHFIWFVWACIYWAGWEAVDLGQEAVSCEEGSLKLRFNR